MTPADFRAARETLGLTQAQLADALGMQRRQIIRLEAGETPITPLHEYAVRWLLSAPHQPNGADAP